jgi:hypothetical protein
VPHPPTTTGRALASEAFRQAGHQLRLLGHRGRFRRPALLHGRFNASVNVGRLIDSLVPGVDTDRLGTAAVAVFAILILGHDHASTHVNRRRYRDGRAGEGGTALGAVRLHRIWRSRRDQVPQKVR